MKSRKSAKATRVCEKSKLYEEWIYFNESYVSELDQREYEKYLEEHEKYREYKQAADKIHEAVEAYIHLEKDVCKDLLLKRQSVLTRYLRENTIPHCSISVLWRAEERVRN